jgi:hypothetical protein
VHGLIPPLTFSGVSIFGDIRQNSADKPSIGFLKEIFVIINGVDYVFLATGQATISRGLGQCDPE